MTSQDTPFTKMNLPQISPLWTLRTDSDPSSLVPPSESPRAPSTELRVVDTSVDSVTLAWTPVSGVSSYILSWRPLRDPGQGEGEARVGVGWQRVSMERLLFNRVLSSAEIPGASQTLPGISSSQQVTGLEPGVTYIFSLTPVREGVQGPTATITQSPSMVGTVGGAQR